MMTDHCVDGDSFKAKIRRLSPRMQEAFLRAAEKLYERESQIMLRLIMESRRELNNTADEIRQEQLALKMTSNEIARQRQEEEEQERQRLKSERRYRKGEYIPGDDDSFNSDSSEATLTMINEGSRASYRIASPRNRPPPNSLPPLNHDRSKSEGDKPRPLNRLDSDLFNLPGKIPGRKDSVDDIESSPGASRHATLSPLPEPQSTPGSRPSSATRARSPAALAAPLSHPSKSPTSSKPSSGVPSPTATSPEYRPKTSGGTLGAPIRSISPNSRPASSPAMGRALILSPEKLEQEKEELLQDLHTVGSKLESERQRQAEKMEQRKHEKMQRKEENEEFVNSLLKQTMDAFERKAQDKERQGAKMKEILLEKKRKREATELSMRTRREMTALSIRSVGDEDFFQDDFDDEMHVLNNLEPLQEINTVSGVVDEPKKPPPGALMKKRTSVFKMSIGDVG